MEDLGPLARIALRLIVDEAPAAAATRVLPRGSFPRVYQGPPAPIAASPSCRTRARRRCQDIELEKLLWNRRPRPEGAPSSSTRRPPAAVARRLFPGTWTDATPPLADRGCGWMTQDRPGLVGHFFLKSYCFVVRNAHTHYICVHIVGVRGDSRILPSDGWAKGMQLGFECVASAGCPVVARLL